MSIPHFFSQPNYFATSELDFGYIDGQMNIVTLYDITKDYVEDKNKVQIMSIMCDRKNYIILYSSVSNNELYGPCIVFKDDVPDITKYTSNFTFTGIKLARINVYGSKFKNVPLNTEITSSQVHQALLPDIPLKMWSQRLRGKQMDIQECDTMSDDNELQKCKCYSNAYKRMYDERRNSIEHLEKVNSQQTTRLNEKTRELKDIYLLTSLVCLFVVFRWLWNDKNLTELKLNIYIITIATLMLYIIYLNWF